jgi:hypothetical protein
VPARPDQRDDHMIAGPQVANTRPDRPHHTCRLVPVDGRQDPAPGTLGVKDVAVAHGTGRNVHLDLARPWRVECHLLDHERPAETSADGREHGWGLRCGGMSGAGIDAVPDDPALASETQAPPEPAGTGRSRSG